MRTGTSLVVALLASATFAAPALGADEGVIFDPPDRDSPAGKEYAIPVDQARRDAAGGVAPGSRGGPTGGQGAAPLFGEGVSRKARDRSRSQSGGPGGGRSSRLAPAGPGAVDDAARAGSPPLARELANDEGGGAARTAVGIVVVVLLTGGLLGWALRRRPTLQS